MTMVYMTWIYFKGGGQPNFPPPVKFLCPLLIITWTEPMATSISTTWVKIYPSEYIYFCNAKVAGLDKTYGNWNMSDPTPPQTL